MLIKALCRRSLATCERNWPADRVAQLMRDQFVEEVVVVETRGDTRVPIGVVTFRDMIVRVVASGTDARATPVGDVMTTALETVHESDTIYAAVSRMHEKKVGRLVVVDATGGLAGVLTADDVADHLAGELTDVLRISAHRVGADTKSSAWRAAR